MNSAEGAGIVGPATRQDSGVLTSESLGEAGDVAPQPSLYAELIRVAVASIVITTAAWLLVNSLLKTLGVPSLS